MRVLLATGDERGSSHLDSVLEATGHEVIRGTSTGAKLLSSIERAGQLHAAVLSQAALGRRWPKLLRQLRWRAPDLPVVVLLGRRADRTWRPAILAGAFDALPAGVPETEVLESVSRALAYAGGEAVCSLDALFPY